MKKKNLLIWAIKVFSAIVSFLLIFYLIQPFFIPNYYEESTNEVKGFYKLEDNSIEVAFFGASQLLCAVDAGRLTDNYGISAYDFGASGQSITIVPYYLKEALKTQKPKVVVVEMCRIFSPNTDINEQILAWNYTPTKPSIDKYLSANEVVEERIKAFNYAFTPLFLFHDRWKTVGMKGTREENDIDYLFHPDRYIDYSSRGYWRRDERQTVNIAYRDNNNTKSEIPDENIQAVNELAELCRSNGIQLIYLKTPVGDWTQGDSRSVKEFMNANNYVFIDLNDHLEEIGIDGNTDFFDEAHLNYSGATKTTIYLSEVLSEYLQ